jgi:hypothetical protein
MESFCHVVLREMYKAIVESLEVGEVVDGLYEDGVLSNEDLGAIRGLQRHNAAREIFDVVYRKQKQAKFIRRLRGCNEVLYEEIRRRMHAKIDAVFPSREIYLLRCCAVCFDVLTLIGIKL